MQFEEKIPSSIRQCLYCRNPVGVRNPKQAEVEILKKKIDNCIKAAGLATGCRVEIKWIMQYLDMQNSKL